MILFQELVSTQSLVTVAFKDSEQSLDFAICSDFYVDEAVSFFIVVAVFFGPVLFFHWCYTVAFDSSFFHYFWDQESVIWYLPVLLCDDLLLLQTRCC